MSVAARGPWRCGANVTPPPLSHPPADTAPLIYFAISSAMVVIRVLLCTLVLLAAAHATGEGVDEE